MNDEFRYGLYSEIKRDWHLYEPLCPMVEVAERMAKYVDSWENMPMGETTREAYERASQKMHEASRAIWWLRRVCDQHAG
jgi:hypothetical protein